MTPFCHRNAPVAVSSSIIDKSKNAYNHFHRTGRSRISHRDQERHDGEDAAVNNGVPGIDGDCGGECACATCHVYVDGAWIDRVGTAEPGGMEANLLQFAEGSTENSRLACQITMTDDLDGLTLRIPEGQH